MIFVTVGTHEQPFNRIIRHIDELKKKEWFTHEVLIQTGFSTYQPEYCKTRKFMSFDELMEHMSQSEMVVTHGGTGSVLMALANGKIPLVVPRQKEYDEHVDDHQVHFCHMMAERHCIIPVFRIEELESSIRYYPQHLSRIKQKNPDIGAQSLKEKADSFSRKLDALCQTLCK